MESPLGFARISVFAMHLLNLKMLLVLKLLFSHLQYSLMDVPYPSRSGGQTAVAYVEEEEVLEEGEATRQMQCQAGCSTQSARSLKLHQSRGKIKILLIIKYL